MFSCDTVTVDRLLSESDGRTKTNERKGENAMGKKIAIIVTVVLATGLCAGIALSAPDKVIKWTMVSTWTPAIDLLEGDKNFARLVTEMSGGRLEITVSPAGELVPATAVFDSVARGSVQAGGDWPSYWAGKNSAFDLLGSYPMGMSQYDYINWYYHYGGKKVVDDLFGKYGIVYFLHCVSPQESGIRTRVPIRNLEDYKGKKLRMSGKAQGFVLQKLGAAQVMVSGGEIYQALQMGTIDGAEFSTPSIDWKMGFGEVTKFNIGPGWHQPASTFGALINKNVWEALPADLKMIVERAAQANMAFMSSWYEVGNIKALQEFENAGTEVIRLSDEDLKIIEGYAWEHLIAESASNPDYRAVALSMFQYLKDFRATRNFQVPFEHGRNPSTIPDLPGLK